MLHPTLVSFVFQRDILMAAAKQDETEALPRSTLVLKKDLTCNPWSEFLLHVMIPFRKLLHIILFDCGLVGLYNEFLKKIANMHDEYINYNSIKWKTNFKETNGEPPLNVVQLGIEMTSHSLCDVTLYCFKNSFFSNHRRILRMSVILSPITLLIS